MSHPASTERLSEAQIRAIERAGRSHGAIEEAQNHLYRALGRAQPRRERKWAERVAHDLERARRAMAAHREEVQGPGGLYDELRFEAPWLLPRVDQLVDQLGRVETAADHLAKEVERVRAGDLQGLPDIRHDAEQTLTSLRDLMAKEADLVWERFNEPVALD